MEAKKSVLTVGIDPVLIDFSHPDFVAHNMTVEKVLNGLEDAAVKLRELGFEAETCLIDLGETAEAVVAEKLRAHPYDCIVIGAGIRVAPGNFLLFEKLVNVVMREAAQARLCFNTKPTDTADAVLRWM